MTGRRSGGEDEAYVLAAVRSYAVDARCPSPPAGAGWVRLAAESRVLPVILDHLERSDRTVPSQIGSWRYVGVATQMRALADIQAVAGALEGTGVRWVVVKGVVLAEVVYRRPSVRPYSDLDVLVHPADLGPALDALEAAGFAVLDRNWQMMADTRRGEISLSSPNGTLLDLHWHLINKPEIRRCFSLDVAAMVERCTTVDIGGFRIPTLLPDDTVVHVALHAVLSGGHRLQWLLDLQQALRWSALDLGDLEASARAAGALLVLRTLVGRAARYVDPGLRAVVRGLGAPSAWAGIGSLVSGGMPPLSSETGRRTGQTFFAATRATSLRSGAELARVLAAAARHRSPLGGPPVDVVALRSAHGGPGDRRRWLDVAAMEAATTAG